MTKPDKNVIAFMDRNGTAEFTCIECGQDVVSVCPTDNDPTCALCRWLPGWRQDSNGRLLPPPPEDEDD